MSLRTWLSGVSLLEGPLQKIEHFKCQCSLLLCLWLSLQLPLILLCLQSPTHTMSTYCKELTVTAKAKTSAWLAFAISYNRSTFFLVHRNTKQEIQKKVQRKILQKKMAQTSIANHISLYHPSQEVKARGPVQIRL